MDEIYHQNTNDDDARTIKCNVVSNPNNFLNSMVLHNKNDLNDPPSLDGDQPHFNTKYKDLKHRSKLEAHHHWYNNNQNHP